MNSEGKNERHNVEICVQRAPRSPSYPSNPMSKAKIKADSYISSNA